MNLSDIFGLIGRLIGRYSRPLLQLSGLILSIVNGLMLLRFYLRDRARLTLHPIHPDTYQWWFTLPLTRNRRKIDEAVRVYHLHRDSKQRATEDATDILEASYPPAFGKTARTETHQHA